MINDKFKSSAFNVIDFIIYGMGRDWINIEYEKHFPRTRKWSENFDFSFTNLHQIRTEYFQTINS